MAQVFATPGSSPNDGIVYPDLTGRYIPVLDAPAVDGLGLTNPWGAGSMAAMTGQSAGGSVVGNDVAPSALTSISGSALSYNVEGLVGPQGPQGPKGDPGSITTIKQQVFVPYGTAGIADILEQIADTWTNTDTMLYTETNKLLLWNRPWSAMNVASGISAWQCSALDDDGSLMFIADETKVYYSSDTGASWASVTPGASSGVTTTKIRIGGATAKGSLIQRATGDDAFFVTSNSGASWSDKLVRDSGGPPYYQAADLYALAHGSDGDTVVAFADTGVFISSDLGTNFSRFKPDGADDTKWYYGTAGNNGQYVLCADDASPSNIYRTANSGAAWATIDPDGGADLNVDVMDMSDDGKYAVIAGSLDATGAYKVYWSSDYGASWADVTPDETLYQWTSGAIGNDGQVILLSHAGTVWVSFNAGVDWDAASIPSDGTSYSSAEVSDDGKVGIVVNTAADNDCFKNSGWYEKPVLSETTITSTARSLLDDESTSAAATTLGLGTGDSPTFTGLTLSGLTATRLVISDGSKALGSTTLASLVAGTASQISVTDDGDNTITLALTGNMDEIAALTPTDGNFIVGNGSTWIAESGATARTSIGCTDPDDTPLISNIVCVNNAVVCLDNEIVVNS